MALVVVDAENVRRSRWPNLSREQLVELTRAWVSREEPELLIVFDGQPPEDAATCSGHGTPTTRSSSSRLASTVRGGSSAPIVDCARGWVTAQPEPSEAARSFAS